MRTLAKFQKQKGLKAQFTQNLLSNQAAFYWLLQFVWPTWTQCKNCMGKLNITACVDFYWNDWISPVKIRWTTVNVTAPLKFGQN